MLREVTNKLQGWFKNLQRSENTCMKVDTNGVIL